METVPADQNTTLAISANISTGREVFETGSLLLVDYDDGLDNGIHGASIRNGGFEDGTALQSLFETPIWVSAFSPEGDATAGTLTTMPATGLRHSQASGFVDAGGQERVQPMQVFDLADWTLAAGDTFDIEYSAMAGANYDGANLQVIVEVIDEFGILVNDPLNGEGTANRWAARPQIFAGDGSSYETFSFSTDPIEKDSPWIGNRVRVRFLTSGGRTAFVNIDDVSITGNYKRLVTERKPLEITFLSVDPESQEITIRFVDTGASGYAIESARDLTFDTSWLYPLDGSEDRTTYPGEIEFSFEDGEVIGNFHAWRVVEQN